MPAARCQDKSHGFLSSLLSYTLCNRESQETKAIGYFIVWFLLNTRDTTLPVAELQASKQENKRKKLCPPSTSPFNTFNYWPTKCESSKEWVSGLGSCLARQVYLGKISSQEATSAQLNELSLVNLSAQWGKGIRKKKNFFQLAIATYLLQDYHIWVEAFPALGDSTKSPLLFSDHSNSHAA